MAETCRWHSKPRAMIVMGYNRIWLSRGREEQEWRRKHALEARVHTARPRGHVTSKGGKRTDEAGLSCGRELVDDCIIMVGTIPCTLGNQCHANMDVMSRSEPGCQYKMPHLMSAAGRKIVGPGYAAVHIHGET
jgi:hypothetical protein